MVCSNKVKKMTYRISGIGVRVYCSQKQSNQGTKVNSWNRRFNNACRRRKTAFFGVTNLVPVSSMGYDTAAASERSGNLVELFKDLTAWDLAYITAAASIASKTFQN